MAEQGSHGIELKQEAVKMVLAQGLTQQEASRRLNIPKGTFLRRLIILIHMQGYDRILWME